MQAIMQVTATDVNAMRRPCPMARCFLLWRGVSAVAGGMEPYKVEGGVSNVIFTQERVCWQMVRKSVKDSIINHQRGGTLQLCSSYFGF